MGLKRFFKSAVKFNKNLLTGKYVKQAVKSGVKFAKKNPALVAGGIGLATGGTGFLGALGGLFGGQQSSSQPSSSSLVGPEQVGEGVVTDQAFNPPIPKEYLFGGAALLAVLLLSRK